PLPRRLPLAATHFSPVRADRNYEHARPVLADVNWGPMETAILLAVAASLCTATASVCQRVGDRSSESESFDARLVLRLARRPIWLLGVASMILGFIFQLT